MRLESKVALISGGARGQGAAEARLFAREGAAVVIGDIRDEDGLKLEAEIRELGGQATCVHLDVTEQDQWQSAVSQAVDQYGKLDILVNNAGITGMEGGGLTSTKIDGTDAELWDRIMAVNSKGVFLGTRTAIPAMRAAGGGSIINISSIAGIVAIAPAAAYAASKGSVRLLTKSTAVQYGREGIRCNSVHPGFIETAMTELRLSVPGAREQAIAETPIRRIGTVDDIANGVLFLASDESSFMTGSELVLDGGWTAQ
ncbi:Cyclopentanol dehydrogenase [Geodia barretti]|uniref:Dehydrogenase/reductase SDR family member 6 n=1 Tax=Geodia barretti TaxID=519541 RepID=A0AA35WYF1_GEOBA|nr:Cyclopentanol dehydrogenase [Geodia barretti]